MAHPAASPDVEPGHVDPQAELDLLMAALLDPGVAELAGGGAAWPPGTAGPDAQAPAARWWWPLVLAATAVLDWLVALLPLALATAVAIGTGFTPRALATAGTLALLAACVGAVLAGRAGSLLVGRERAPGGAPDDASAPPRTPGGAADESSASQPPGAVRRRRGRLLALGCGCAAAGLVAMAFAASAPLLWLGIALVGFGGGVGRAARGALAVELATPARRMSAAVRAHAGATLGPLLVYGVVLASWRLGLLGLAALALILGVAALLVEAPAPGLHDALPVRRRVNAWGRSQAPVTERAELTFGEATRRVMRAPAVRPAVLVQLLGGTAVVGAVTLALDVLRERQLLVEGTRLGLLAVAGVIGLVLVAVASRWCATPWAAVAAGLLLALAGAAGWPALVVAAVAVAVAVAVASESRALAVASGAVAPALRPLLAALLCAAWCLGAIQGRALVVGLADRYGLAVTAAVLGLTVAWLAGPLRKLSTERGAEALARELIEDQHVRALHAAHRPVPLLACRGIDFSYGQLQVLFDVSFTLREGEMVALLGTNGAGKSTLLRVISGLGIPSRGSVRLAGRDITYLDPTRRAHLGVLQVPGGRATFPRLTVLDNLRAYGYALGRDRRLMDQRIDEVLARFPRLAERSGQLAVTLSGGEAQMLALGKVLLLRPRVLLIDELSLGLAPKVVADLLELVQAINASGTAIVLVEQSVNIALSLVDHAYFMEKGEIRFDGRAADLLGRDDLLRSVFLAGATT